MGRAKPKIDFDRELLDLPAPMRRREYMMRVEAVIFAASQPVSRETLSALIGSDCNLNLLIADIRDELRSRPYELVDVAGGFQHRTRRAYGEVIRASGTVASKGVDLTALEKLVLTAVAYFQPVTRVAAAAPLCGGNPRQPSGVDSSWRLTALTCIRQPFVNAADGMLQPPCCPTSGKTPAAAGGTGCPWRLTAVNPSSTVPQYVPGSVQHRCEITYRLERTFSRPATASVAPRKVSCGFRPGVPSCRARISTVATRTGSVVILILSLVEGSSRKP
jgi:Segregation and condensation complex subunit ScpB